MRIRTRNLVLLAVLAAIMLLFGFTPIGYIPLPFAKITLMCIPLLIGCFLLGKKSGLVLSGVFIFTSIFQLLTAPDAVSLILFENNPVLYILCLIVPRVLIPFTSAAVYTAMREKHPRTACAVAAVTGSLTNTFIYLGMLQIFFVPALSAGMSLDTVGVAAMIWGVVLTNGLPEAAAAGLICTPVVSALKKSYVRTV